MENNRPIYETEEDIANEQSIKIYIEKKFNCTLEKLTRKYFADYIAFRNEDVVALIEIKVRKNSITTYIDYMISLHKVLSVLAYCERLLVPFMLYVQWTDAFGYVEITTDLLKIIRMMKKDFRNDKADIEPCVYIPIDKFKIIKDKNI